MPFVHVSAARMLRECADDLRCDDVALVVAPGIGQVRDVLRADAGDAVVEVHPTVDDAVEAVLGA